MPLHGAGGDPVFMTEVTTARGAWCRLGWIALAVFSGLACADLERLDLQVLTSAGADPFAAADRLRLAISDPASEQIMPLQDKEHFELGIEVEVESQVGMIALEAYAGSTMVARGETPPLVLAPASLQLNLLVSAAGVLSPLKARMDRPAEDMMSVLMPALGVLMAGGCGAQGESLAEASLYDFFLHQLLPTSPVPGGRSGGVTATCGSTCGLLFLGDAAEGLAATILRYEAGLWTEVGDQLPPAARRRHSTGVLLEDGDTLVIGGEGTSGPLDTVLRLNPGTLYMEPQLALTALRTRQARVKPAAALGTGAVVIVGGQPAGGRSAEILYVAAVSSQDLALGGPAVSAGAAALSLADGRVLIIGGRTEDGSLLRDAWIIDTLSLEVTHLPQVLARGRADHQVLKVAGRLVVVGGETEAGLAAEAEVLAADGLAAVAQPVMKAPRTGFVMERLGVGSFLVAGGVGASGPEPVMEVYQTDESLW